MSKQNGERDRESSATALEERVRALEDRVGALFDAMRILAHGLEDLPTAEPGQRPAAEAARRAYDLLLVAGAETRGQQPGTGGEAT